MLLTFAFLFQVYKPAESQELQKPQSETLKSITARGCGKWGTTAMKPEMEQPYTYPVIAFMKGLRYRFKQNTRLRR